jgi:hypothetical protein
MLHAVCFRVKLVGKPDAGDLHVRFDERGCETGLYATAPLLDSTSRHIRVKFKVSYRIIKSSRVHRFYYDCGELED